MSGDEKQHQLVADRAIRQRPTGLRVGGFHQGAHQRCITLRVGSTRLQDLAGQFIEGRDGGAGSPLSTGRQPAWWIQRAEASIGRPLDCRAKRGPDHSGLAIQINSKH